MKTTHRRSTPAYGRGSLRTARRPRLGGGGTGKVQVENPADPPSYHLQPDNRWQQAVGHQRVRQRSRP
jgi:hypothetical protein